MASHADRCGEVPRQAGPQGEMDQRVVSGQRGLHALGLLLPELRAAVDVGEQESYRNGHGHSIVTGFRNDA
jgi:hypothetical protein